jgi:anti-sigma B factor antagonist
MPFQLERSSHNSGTEVFKLSGTLTMGTQLQSLEWALEDASKQQGRAVLLDMAGVSYIDSSAVGVLMASNGLFSRSGGQMRLAGVTDRVLHILKLTKVDTILSIDTQSASAGAGPAA